MFSRTKRNWGRFLHDYRTFCASPQAEFGLQVLEACPVWLLPDAQVITTPFVFYYGRKTVGTPYRVPGGQVAEQLGRGCCLEGEPGAVGAQPGAADRTLGMIGGDQGPETRGVAALLEVGELVHDDVVEHLGRGHDQMNAQAE